jgi:hypothetical protein
MLKIKEVLFYSCLLLTEKVLSCLKLLTNMKYQIALFALLLVCRVSFAQTNTFPSTGNVGIGALSPGAKLSFNNLNDGSNGPDGITWYNVSPLAYGIHRTEGAWVAPNYQQLRISFDTGIIMDPGAEYGKSYVDIKGGGLRVTTGNIGIGTIDTKGYRLAIAGSMIAESIKVKLQGSWPDFVFAKKYQLPSLQLIARQIRDLGHLPGIPSEAEVKANGIDLGKMNVALLQKVEELTLHLIEKDKELTLERKRNQDQERRLKKLETIFNKKIE